MLPAELKWQLLSPEEATSLPDLPQEAEGEQVLVIRYLQLDDDSYVKFTGKIKTIEGVWDLPMIGGEKLDIEERYQQLTNGPQINRLALEGVVIQGPSGELCQLQEQFSFKEYSSKWDSEHRELKQHLAAADIVEDEAERLLNQHKEERKQILKMMKALTEEESYYPARRLPKESNLVIRMDALTEFENHVKTFRSGPVVTTPDAVAYRVPGSCGPVNASMIKRHFNVKTDRDENVEWWTKMMRNASDNGLVNCRVGKGAKGRGSGSMWRPDLIAGWLVDRHKKGRDGLSEKVAGVALKKFSGCEEAADTFFAADE